jgi:hypothetical protein
MRSLCALVLLAFSSIVAFSQDKILPEIKKGAMLTYQVSVNGQLFPVAMRIDSLTPDFNRFNWSMQDGNSGYVVNTKASLDNANHAYWSDLRPGEELTMPPDQTILVLSRNSWNALQKDKKFKLDEQEFIVKDQPQSATFKLKDKAVNALYAESANGAKVWFLNNSSFPLLLKIEGNPAGVDVSLQSIE